MRALEFLPVIALVLGFQANSQTIERTWDLPEGVKTAKVNGYEMAYVERGSGDPLIFIHGAGVDYRYFAAQMEPFSAKYRSIAVSLRRYYPEPWRGEGEFSLNQHAEDLAAFAKQLNSGPVHLVGHSRGGTVALYASSKLGDMVRTLTFAKGGTGMTAFSTDDPVLTERSRIANRAMTEKLKKGEVDAGLEIFVENVNGPGGWQRMPDSTRNVLRSNAWTLVAGQSDLPRWAPFSCEDAKQLKVPVLLLEAESSPGLFKKVLDNVQACLPRSTREVVRNSSHAMPRMNPDGFNASIMSFIAPH